MYLKDLIKEYFSFGRKDRMGILALVLLIVIVFFLPRVFEKEQAFLPEEIIVPHEEAFTKLDEEEAIDVWEQNKPVSAELPKELFVFDPNSLSEKGWLKLGASEKLAKTILNYRNKGGKFYRVEDLQKIWGMSPGFYERIKSYVQLPEKKQEYERNEFVYEKKVYEKPAPSIVNINEADSLALEQLPGIGPKLSARIIAYRKKLGGFYKVEQVGETYGLADSVFQKIKNRFIISGVVKKISINTATKEELKDHPYVRWKLANAIVAYREQHGNFKNANDLKKLIILDEATIEKLLPYLEF